MIAGGILLALLMVAVATREDDVATREEDATIAATSKSAANRELPRPSQATVAVADVESLPQAPLQRELAARDRLRAERDGIVRELHKYAAQGNYLARQALAKLSVLSAHTNTRGAPTAPVPAAEQSSAAFEIEARKPAPAKRANAPPPATPSLRSPQLSSTPGDIDPIRREPWLVKQNPEHLTVQVLASTDRQAVEGFVRQRGLEDELVMVPVLAGDQVWYKALYGSYPTLASATEARRGLEERLKSESLWLRKFADVQHEAGLSNVTTRSAERRMRAAARSSIPDAQALAAWQSAGHEGVVSMLEMRRRNVVVQEWDLSCGAAALTTLLNYQHGDPVAEKNVATALMRRGEYVSNPELVKIREGFSLLDLKRYVDARGYTGNGYGRLELDDLLQYAPLIVPIKSHGYNHFVVFRGMHGDRVLLADPAWGNRTMPVEKFMRSWISYPNIGQVGFAVARSDGGEAPNQLTPDAGEFVMLR
ncbi:MAG: cysteine peptidase family C39 domain-containing protein [Gammaproteobacteria bacterium]|nr:cysteine peptidase family C39 domain-containing protein [Gammaproteobacteria bacterium]